MKNTASDGTGLSRLESSFSFKPKNRRKSDNHLREEDRSIEPGNLPRVSKLMALAIRFDGLVQRGEVRDYADLARLGYVTRARITQIMNLLNLARTSKKRFSSCPGRSRGVTRFGRKRSVPLPPLLTGHVNERYGLG